jgi:rod shape-determining protein MreD
MRGVVLLLLVYLVLGFLGPLVHRLEATQFVPEVTVVFVVYATLNLPFLAAAITVFFIGLMKDAFVGGGVIGMYSEVLLLVFLLTRFLMQRYRVSTSLGVMLATLGGIVAQNLLFLIFSLIFDSQFKGAYLVVKNIFPELIVSLPVVPLLLLLIRKTDQWLFRTRPRLFG